MVEGPGGAALEGLVRPLVVELTPEGVEGALLRRQRRAGRSNGGGFEGPVHALMGPVLLGLAGQNPLMLHAEAHPPDVELGEAVEAGGGEGDPVVGPHRGGEPALGEDLLEHLPDTPPLGGPKP